MKGDQGCGSYPPCQRGRRRGCRSNLEDPYIRLGGDGEGSEEADDAIRDSDLVILAARNEDDVSHLEVAPISRSRRRPGAWPCIHLWTAHPAPFALLREMLLPGVLEHGDPQGLLKKMLPGVLEHGDPQAAWRCQMHQHDHTMLIDDLWLHPQAVSAQAEAQNAHQCGVQVRWVLAWCK